MLRKGIVENLAGIMLVVISISAVATTLNSIQSQTLDDSSQGLMDSLNQFNGEVDIETEEQFRGLVTWNMLASQQCLYANMIYNRGDVGEPPGDLDIGEDEVEMSLADSSEILTENGANIQNLDQGDFTFFGDASADTDPIRSLVDETTFTGECVGAEAIGITRSPLAAAGLIGNDLLGSGLQELEGYSLEGDFGEVPYNMQETVLIEDEKLFAMRIDNFWWDAFGGNGPDFVRGQRASIFVPHYRPDTESADRPILDYLGESSNLPTTTYGFADYPSQEDIATYWAFRVRMKNIPMIVDVSGDNFESGDKDYSEEDFSDEFQNFLQDASYLMCRNSTGTIKSNAGKDPETSSVERGTNPVPRDVVYPVVESTSDGENCIESGDGTEGIKAGINSGRFAPIGGRVYFGEDQPMTTTGYDEYLEPRYTVNENNGAYMSDRGGEMVIGEYAGQEFTIPYKSVLASTVSENPLGLDWIEPSASNLYTRQFGLETEECPDQDVAYDISDMHRVSEDTQDSKALLFPVNRFESDNLEAEIRLDASVDGEGPGSTDIRLTGYSSAGEELSAFVIDETGSDRRGYTLTDAEGGNSLDSQSSNSEGDVTINYDYDALNSQSIEISDPLLSQGESPQATVDDASYKLRYIEIEASQGADFEVEQFEVQASPEGCNP